MIIKHLLRMNEFIKQIDFTQEMNENAGRKFEQEYARFSEFFNIKFLSNQHIVEISDTIESLKKRKNLFYKNDISFTVFNFYSKEALYLYKIVFEKTFDVSITRIYTKKINNKMYKIYIFISKPYSDTIQDAINSTLEESKQIERTNLCDQHTWYITELIRCNLEKNNKSSFKLNILRIDIPFSYLNVNLIYIATEYIKTKYNKEVSCVKKESKYNESTYYFEVFPDKIIKTLNYVCGLVCSD